MSDTKQRSVTPDTALRLAKYFRTMPQFWLNLQMSHDLSVAEAEEGPKIEAEVQPIAA